MFRLRRYGVQIFGCAVLLAGTAQAAGSAVRVMVSRHVVRFTGEGRTELLRVQVSSLDGEEVFDTGSRSGSEAEWNRQDRQGRTLGQGVYLATVTVRDEQGNVSQQVEEVLLEGEAEQDAGGVAPAEVLGGGTAGRIARWTNATTLGNAAIAESGGRIGIGTTLPGTVLQVNGSQPPALPGNGSFALGVLSVLGGRGGNTTAAGFTGGRGASLSIISGPGGNAVGGSTNGNGGTIIVQGGAPGTGGAGGVRGNILLNSSGGNVGIGTNAPMSRLEVVGGTLTGVVGTSSGWDGVGGVSSHASHAGVAGHNSSGLGFGVYGSSGRYGVFGTAGNGGYGVYGISGGSGTGVHGESSSLYGVNGVSTNSIGVRGVSTNNAGIRGISINNIGIHGQTFNAASYAGYFQGRVHVNGALTKSSGSFQIDHPLDPANKLLSHSFVESPDMKNIYDGLLALDDNGEATVEMPAWFQALNSDFRYQLTCVGGYAPVYIAQEVQGNRFKIAGGKPGLKVSWMLTGIRQDAYAQANRIAVEEDKPEKERGYYLHPKEFGQPEEKNVERARNPELSGDRLADAAGKAVPTPLGQ